MRSLLQRFRATVEPRPLLVEGMLASESTDESGMGNASRWIVLVDQETYPITEDDVAHESPDKPLPERLRNTIAHELAHSIAFRPNEFHVELELGTSDQSKSALVEEIERETERLSPLLLWPENSISATLLSRSKPFEACDLAVLRRKLGISRYVLINRLRMIPAAGGAGFRQCRGLRNLAIVLGEWLDAECAVLRKWPIFANFDRQILPQFLLKVMFDVTDRSPASEMFNDRDFVLSGGSCFKTAFETRGGVEAASDAEPMHVKVSVEETSRRPGTRFLIAVTGEIAAY